MSSTARTAGRVAALLVTVVVGAACGSSGGRTETVSPSPSATPNTTATPSATATPNAAGCEELLAAGTVFTDALTGFAQGQTSLDQLTTAAKQLLTTVDAAVGAATETYRDLLTQLQGELQAMQSALNQTPPVPSSIRAAGRKVVSTLAALARPCVSASPTTS